MKKRIISALLLASMMSAVMASCGSSDTPSDTNADTTASAGETSADNTATGRAAVKDDLPAESFNGAKFTILTRTKYDYEFGVEEENGDLINDAVYKRNTTVEERFGVDIVTHAVPSGWGNEATAFNTMLTASIMAGDGAFDLVAGYAATIPKIVSEGIFMNLAEVDYLDFSKPWWSETVAEELTINGKAYMVTGDISLALWKGMTCFFYNKRLAEDYKIGDMYEIVRNGEWTFDKLIELTKNTYEDLDGNSTVSEADKFGLLLNRDTETDNLKEAFEIYITKKGSDGFPEFVFKNERTIEAVTKLNSYIHDSGSVLFLDTGGDTTRAKLATAFSEGRGIFLASTLGVSETLRAMDDDFGIIPYPKYDDNQESYHSTSLDEFSLFLIPVDVKNVKMSAIITEALCAESYKQVIPIFYETALKTKAARDDESAEMIDTIRDGLVFDFGYLHSSTLGGVGHRFVNYIRDNNNDVVSDYDSKASTFEQNLEKVLEVYR